MNKSFKIASGITVTIAVIFGIGFLLFQNAPSEEPVIENQQEATVDLKVDEPQILQDVPLKTEQEKKTVKTGTSGSHLPILSADQKSINSNEGKLIVSIDNDAIFDWFKSESQLCDGYNLTSTPNRKAFCESKMEFKKQTQFKSIVVSPDGMEIGFTIESEALSPDTVVGIFSQSNHMVKLLTGYYLGNEFISFSPNGTHFIYTGECWEAMCGLFIGDSKTLNEVVSINNPEYLDLREWDAEFVQWISESEVEYKLQSTNSDEVKIERQSL